MEVVGRLAGTGVLVKRLVGREHQWQVAIEQIAQRLETPLQTLPTGPTGGQHREHRRAEVLGELANEGADQLLAGQSLAPQGRTSAPGDLGDALERQPAEPALSRERRSWRV